MGPCEHLDGGAVHPLPFLGGLDPDDRILAILSKPEGAEIHLVGFWGKLLFRRYFRHHDWMEEKLALAERHYQEHVAFLEQEARGDPPRAVVIHPENPTPAGFLTRNARKLNRTIDLGYRQVETLESEIARFSTPAPDRTSPPRLGRGGWLIPLSYTQRHVSLRITRHEARAPWKDFRSRPRPCMPN